MVQPTRRRCESNIYHVVNRGVGKQIIFENDEDKALFYSALSRKSAEYAIKMYAWCLMDNHVHLLVKGEMDQVSAFMQNVLSVYAVGFNRRYGRTGHLFEGRFQSEPIETESHLLAAVRYIHQNPQKAKMATTETYRWSSYGEYVDAIPPTGNCILIDRTPILHMLGSVDGFVSFHGIESRDCFLEPEDSRTSAHNKRALRIALEELGAEGLFTVKSLPKEERNAVLKRLKERGLTLRQIERYTGVSKSQISRLGNEENGANGIKHL